MLWVGESVVRSYQEKHSNSAKSKVVMQIQVSAFLLTRVSRDSAILLSQLQEMEIPLQIEISLININIS